MRKMNNNGQALIMFILLLPLIVFIFAYMIESASILYTKTRLQNLVNDSCTEDNISDYILKNEPDAMVSITDNEIKVEKEIKSTFANIVGIDTFTIKVTKMCESGD